MAIYRSFRHLCCREPSFARALLPSPQQSDNARSTQKPLVYSVIGSDAPGERETCGQGARSYARYS
jgi:hypothetical protein